jgi:hypothetical protein
MRAKVTKNYGIYGIQTHSAGDIVEVEPFLGPYGDKIPELFQDKYGSVWPSELLDPLPTNNIFGGP